MALSSDQSYLVMVSHQVYPYSAPRCNLRLGEKSQTDTAIHCNTIYLLNLNIIRNDLKLTLVDSLRLESVVETGRSGQKQTHCEFESAADYVKYYGRISDELTKKQPDLLSSVHFLETRTTNYLLSLNSESCRFYVHSIEKDCLHEICLNADFKDKFSAGGVRLIQGGWLSHKDAKNGRNSIKNGPDDDADLLDSQNVFYVCGKDRNLTRMEFLA